MIPVPVRRLLALAALALCTPGVAAAATSTSTTIGFTPPVTAPVYDTHGHLLQTPFVPTGAGPRLTSDQATAIFLENPKVKNWVGRYPVKGRRSDATYDKTTGSWTVNVWWGTGNEPGE